MIQGLKVTGGALSVSDLEQLLRHMVRASHESRYCPLMIWGEAGVGKSQTVARVAKDLGIGFKDLRLGLFEAPDLVGVFRQQEVFPCFLDFEEGRPNAEKGRLYTRYALFAHLWNRHRNELPEEGPDQIVDWAIAGARERGLGHLFGIRTVNSPPSWLPQPGTRGILFLDELNRANREVRQATFQIVLDRIVGQIPLPSGWILVSANNPPDVEGKGMGYRVNETQDRAFLSRWCHVGVEPKVGEWLSWARRSGVNPAIRAFISEHGSEYLGSSRGVGIPAQIGPTPRSWTMLSKIIKPVPPRVPGEPESKLDEHLMVAAANGLVGFEATRTWMALRMIPDPLVTISDLLVDYNSAYQRLKKFLDYPIYEPGTAEPMVDDSGQIVTSRRSDLIRVALETASDSLLQMNKKRSGGVFTEEGYDPKCGDVRLVATSLRLLQAAALPESADGLGMQDVALQFLKQWVKGGSPPIDLKIILTTTTSSAMKQALDEAGVKKDTLVGFVREIGKLTGH